MFMIEGFRGLRVLGFCFLRFKVLGVLRVVVFWCFGVKVLEVEVPVWVGCDKSCRV